MKSSELPFVRDMFDRIAPRYDFLNRLLSLRRDVYWRRALADGLNLSPHAQVLDVACGTADVVLEVARRVDSRAMLVGVDFAPQMLQSAKAKVKALPREATVRLAAADAFDLPFGPECFEAITIAFGIRNIQDKAAVLREFYALLKPGGRLAVLELASPEKGLLRRIYLSYFHRLLPLLGRLFSKHSYAYTYLPASVAKFPPARAFAALMRAGGFKQVRYRKMTLGIAVLFIGDKLRSLR